MTGEAKCCSAQPTSKASTKLAYYGIGQEQTAVSLHLHIDAMGT